MVFFRRRSSPDRSVVDCFSIGSIRRRSSLDRAGVIENFVLLETTVFPPLRKAPVLILGSSGHSGEQLVDTNQVAVRAVFLLVDIVLHLPVDAP